MKQKIAIIIGAGPAGLTAAYELLTRTNIKPIVIEKDSYMGGLSKTINYKGNRIDIGGHRFFSKSDRVMKWWLNILPLEKQQKFETSKNPNKITPATTDNDNAMLTRQRKSQIYFNRTFFDYPISLTPKTIASLGFKKTIKMGFSYLKIILFPIKKEKNLEDFFINRFGKELYLTFFKSYTEKLWGIPCNKISSEWGAQRVKGVSISKSILHFIKSIFKSKDDVKQKKIETSLIAQFLYPKYGPGQMWETVAKKIKLLGGEIIINNKVDKVEIESNNVLKIKTTNINTQETKTFEGDYFFSTMPIQDLIRSFNVKIPTNIKTINEGLIYRDFITVGLLLNKLKIKGPASNNYLIKDNWVYIQESDVSVGRLQIFNNWSPYMVSDQTKVWVGLEYFCNKDDKLWNKSEQELINLAIHELDKIKIIDKSDFLDGTIIKTEKTYPAYFGTYNQFDTLKNYLDKFKNLYLIGRNGMHKYNNQDHSMLSAMTAVDNIVKNKTNKSNIWAVNTEKEYHETK